MKGAPTDEARKADGQRENRWSKDVLQKQRPKPVAPTEHRLTEAPKTKKALPAMLMQQAEEERARPPARSPAQVADSQRHLRTNARTLSLCPRGVKPLPAPRGPTSH